MMRTITVGKSGHARIWCGELPDAAYEAIATSVHVTAADPELRSVPRLVALEMVRYVSGRGVLYGLLGGQWTPELSSKMTVRVGVSHDTGRMFSNSLAGSFDKVMVGFPSQYEKSVPEGVELAKAGLGGRLGGGELLIHCAAHGAIGSCHAMFSSITATLVKLLHRPNLEPSDEELASMLSAA
jgi:hypothetical protein